MNPIEKVAFNDAREFVKMQFLSNAVAWRTERLSGYGEAFDKYYYGSNYHQDLDGFARQLEKQSRWLEKATDGGTKLPKSPKKVRTVLLIGVGAFALHASGLDVVLAEKARKSYRRAQLWWTVPADENGKHEA